MDKIDRLLDMTEHPEHYSPAEIEEMLRDPEVKEAFDVLDKMKSSLMPVDTPDIEDEWRSFERNHRKSGKTHLRWLRRFVPGNVAASIVIGITSCVAVAAIVGVGIYSFNQPSQTTTEGDMTSGTDIIASQPDTVMTVKATGEVTPEIIVFDEETLATIMDHIAVYYGYQVIFNNNDARSLRLYFRWNQALPVEDIIESLGNFEQITLSIKGRTITID